MFEIFPDLALVYPKSETVILQKVFKVGKGFIFFMEDKGSLISVHLKFLLGHLLLLLLFLFLFLIFLIAIFAFLGTHQTLIQKIFIFQVIDILISIFLLALNVVLCIGGRTQRSQ